MCCGDNDDEDGKNRKASYKAANYADPNYEGEPTSAKLAKGPVDDRHCTDILCCLIFCGFSVFLVTVAMKGMADGKPEKLLDLYDPDGNACGRTAGFEDYKYMYFWLPIPGQMHKRSCLKKCEPFADAATRSAKMQAHYESLTGSAPSAANQFQCKPNTVVKVCYGKTLDPKVLLLGSSDGGITDSMRLIYPTTPCTPLILIFSSILIFLQTLGKFAGRKCTQEAHQRPT